jgi:hypothetical protein
MTHSACQPVGNLYRYRSSSLDVHTVLPAERLPAALQIAALGPFFMESYSET